jgi:hypothetical protein
MRSGSEQSEDPPASLTVSFSEGFTNDVVTVSVNGREVMRLEGVQTIAMTGSAGSHRIQVPHGPLEVEVALPSRNLSGRINLVASVTPYLVIDVSQGYVVFIKSAQAVGYQ